MQRYNSFNGLRGFAAIGILLMHYLANMDANIVLPLKQSNPLLYGSIIPFFTTFVYMFFIISAFSMCCGYFKKFTMKSTTSGEVSEFNTDKFYLKRYSRIWPFFALLVGIDVVLKPSVSEIYQAFADLTLAFNLLPNPDISVIGVGWFLGLIFLFYMIFPWFVFLLQSKKRAWFALIISVAFHFILIRYFLTSEFCTESQIANFRHNMIYSFPFFMIGGILYLYKDKLQLTKNLLKTILLLITVIATSWCFTYG
jgi:peptidoglycan/LPS O-acetylase OafA/YrhL